MVLPPLSESLNLQTYGEKLYDHASFVIAENDEDVVGLLAYYRNDEDRQLYIPLIAVVPTSQGRGLGGKLLQTLIDGNGDFHSVALEVRKNNVQALHFYRKHGFVEQEDRGEKVLMSKRL